MWPGRGACAAGCESLPHRTIQCRPANDGQSAFGAPLIHALAQHGYTQDRNVMFERRGAEGRLERLPGLLEELVASKVDAIFALGYPATLAAKRGAKIPIVSILAGDPVATGLADSLARPGGNLTGGSRTLRRSLRPNEWSFLKSLYQERAA